MKQNPTTTIKCTFSNEVHKLLEPNIDLKRRDRWKLGNKKYELTDKEKIELFDKINNLHQICSNELTSYQYNKREKKRFCNLEKVIYLCETIGNDK